MATAKTYENLQDDVKKTLMKWQPLIEKCGHLETLDEKLLLANTLEKLASKAQGVQGPDYVLSHGETLNVVDQSGTNRFVLEYDDNCVLCANHQHKDWVDG